MLLIASFGAFTVAALFGVMLAVQLFNKRKWVNPGHVLAHLWFVVLGTVPVIIAAVQGDIRVYANIGLVVVIAVLGFLMHRKRIKTGELPKRLFIAHAGLAVTCYILLGMLAFNLPVPGINS